ncbi:hypothetical protein [Paenibacillus lutrae]|uniref:Uncharacterized protein n=1 Tax=Paenibacillus lutrae TaxID=2078573 RepID=A0A7X3JXP9_9BACL|nr:hypothetical protein [Paenibacillus lutrae]MVO98268.1 hypothetical protein [Paenibacillus lutrae]
MESADKQLGTITGTIEEQCEQFGIILGLNGPVSEEVLFAAVHDTSYAHNLLAARRSEMFLNHLLNNPPAVGIAGETEALGATGARAAGSAGASEVTGESRAAGESESAEVTGASDAAASEATEVSASAGGSAAAHSNTELAKKAGQALWKWARTGFATVEDDVYRRRMSACEACPHIQSKPDKLLYNALSSATSATGGAAEKICGKCGCVLSKKTRLPTESCPDEHPDLAGMTRWEEPVPAI